MIEVFHRQLPSTQCTQLIELFEQDPRKQQGQIGGGAVRTEDKQSTDVRLDFQDNNPYNDIFYQQLQSCIKQYYNKYRVIDGKNCSYWELSSQYQLQKYIDGEGYHIVHFEQEFSCPNRILAWMIYLNDSPCGTYFPYQDTTTNAIQGDVIVWPAFFTHPHRGVTPNVGTKYILTGWCEWSLGWIQNKYMNVLPSNKEQCDTIIENTSQDTIL